MNWMRSRKSSCILFKIPLLYILYVRNLREIFAHLIKDRRTRSTFFRLLFIFLVLAAFPFNLYSQAYYDFKPELYGIIPLNEPWKRNNVSFNDKIYYYLTQNPKLLSARYSEVDSTSQKFIIGQKLSRNISKISQVIDIDNLLINRFKVSNKDLLFYRFTRSTGEKIKKASGFQRRGVGFSIPMPTKSKMFQNLIGSDINLNVTGSVSIKGNLIQRQQNTVKTNINQSSDYTFKLEQTQKFNIGGNIGKLMKMNIDQDSQRQFDYLNVVNLNYTGKEDDIVQEFHAGNIALSLPGTRFVTFSGNSQGLFGLKSSVNVGDFKLTTIASLEKGQKQKLSLKGGSKASSNIIKDYEYVKGTYFFIDDGYRDHFKFSSGSNYTMLEGYDQDRVISDIEVWKAGRNYHLRADSREGWALQDADMGKPGGLSFDTTGVENQDNRRGNFVRLEQNKNYFVNKEFGYIIMEQRAMDEILAVSYSYGTKNEVQGTLYPKQGETLILKMIRTDTPRSNDKTWDLEWKNVYFLGRRNIDPAEIEINIIDNRSGTREKLQPGGLNYLEVFNLDKLTEAGERRSDDKVDISNTNLFNFFRGELLFPSKRPFDPKDLQSTDLLNEKRNPLLYDTLFVNQSDYTKISKFDIEVKLSSASASYDLGFNLLPGSEEITLGGQPLVKGIDYEVDYNTGRLQMLNEQALKPGSNLDIKYENGEMFQLDKKTILGMRGEYKFLNDGFIGFTGLSLGERILEQRVKLDREPIKNFVWDINTRFSLEPNFITKMLDFLPLIDTNTPSSLLFEGEIGQVMPNPNTISIGSTGDDNGVADLDNFEGSSLFTTISIMRKSWFRSSIPYFENQTTGDPSLQPRANERGKLVWYSPWQQVEIKDIFPNKDVNTRTGTMTNVLVLKRLANKNYSEPSIFNWWDGITSPLSTSYYNQSETRFVELWVKGEKGSVHFDMGLISEDAIHNGVLNTEDFMGGRNGILDHGEDVGLDGFEGKDGTNPEETYDDDWAYTFKSDDYSMVNGTEGNGSGAKIDGLLIPDTEDINRNGVLDTRNDYFEYSFTLGTTHPDYDSLVVGGQDNPKGWRLYRIPIGKVSKPVGNPDLTRIEFVRIWIEGLDIGDEIQIASINLAGNDWKEVGVSSNIDSIEFKKRPETINISVINTEENEAEYERPPGVFGLEDRITGAIQREQSLVFKYSDIVPGEAAAISKSFMKEQDAIHYKELKMFVHGDDNINTLSDSTSDLLLFFRFGRDENSYFEVRQHVFPGWEKNEIKIPLTKLSALEFDFPETRAGYPEWGGGKFYKMVGNPTSRQIRVITVGIINKGFTFKSGDIWLDELRVSNVEKVNAIAMRTLVDLKLADIGSISGNLEKRDADFHNVNDRWGTGGNTLNYNFQTNFDLGRVISSEKVFSIPIALSFGKNENVPKYLTGKDILIGSESVPDSLVERETVVQKNSSFNFSFKKNIPSKNWYVRNTIDKISFSYAGTNSFSKDFNTKFRKAYTGNTNFSYSQTFNIEKFGLNPFGWIGENRFLIGRLAGLKLSFLPNSFNFSGNTSESRTNSLLIGGIEKPVNAFNLTKSYQVGFTPLNNLTVQINRNNVNDMRDVKSKLSMFTGNFGEEVSMTQNITTSYQLNIFSWLTPRLNFSSNYSLNNNIQLPEAGKSANSTTTKQGDLSINLAEVFGFTKSQGAKTTSVRRNVRIRKPIAKDKKDEEEEKKEKDEGEKKGFFIFRGFGHILNMVNPIALKYNQNVNVQSVGLDNKPKFMYQLGLDKDHGAGIVENVGSQQSTVGGNDNYTISSGINLFRNIKIPLNYTKTVTSSERGNTLTGNETETYLIYGDKKMPFFNWNLNLGGIEKLLLFRSLFRTVSINHAYSGSKATQIETQTIDNKKVNLPSKEAYSSGFKPIVGITFNWKNGMSSKFSWNISEMIDDNLKVQSSRKVVQEDMGLTTNYSKSGGFRLPIPFLSSKRVNNNINFRLTFSSNSSATFNSNDEGEYIKFSENSKWFLKPEISYSFSSKISGGMHFEIGKTKDKLSGERATKDFGLSVDIIIAGG